MTTERTETLPGMAGGGDTRLSLPAALDLRGIHWGGRGGRSSDAAGLNRRGRR